MELNPAIIRSDERMTYGNVNRIIAKDEQLVRRYAHLLLMIDNMIGCSALIRKRRHALGAVNFETRESKVIVDEQGVPQDIVLRERGESERIIEDFMIAANECVAAYLKWMDLPAMYRVHEQPEPKKVRAFAKVAKTLGYSFIVNVSHVYPGQFQQLLECYLGWLWTYG